MAGLIPEETIAKVRDNVNIVNVISQYVSLEKKGKDYVGLCPFHEEKTPSFTVNEGKQFFKCFGCGKGGNVFTFLMEKENLTFPESVQKVAEIAHIDVGEFTNKTPKYSNILIKINEEAADFYHRVLLSTNAGKRGLDYAHQRGLTEEIIDHFRIGYAPKQNNLLLTYLRGHDYQDQDLIASGLFVQGQSGELFDRFRDRLMFTLTNEGDYAVGFSGRRLSNDKTEAKYMNSPETKVFEKSNVLFHFAEAKKAARAEGHLVLYEGYMDVIAAYQAGVKSGIASMGTSLTEQQVYMLKRITKNIIINYDGDDPGVHAEERATKLFEKAGGFNLGVVVLPEKLDPDEYVKKYGVEKYRDEIKGALTPTDFYLKRLAKKYNLSNDREKLLYLDEAVREIAQLSNPVEQDLYLEKIARQQRVSLDSLKVNLVKYRRQFNAAQQHKGNQSMVSAEQDAPPEIVADTSPANDPVQTRLLYLFIHSEHARDYLLENKFLFPDQNYQKLAELWLNFSETQEKPTVNSFLNFIPSQLQGIIVNAEMTDMPQDFSDRELSEQIRALQMRQLNDQLHDLMNNLQDAKRKMDSDEIITITQKILQLKRIQG
ncbi:MULTISPECIES: DNA primase [unclassified Lactobacillus]|uniref:DNA primase n=1 Tax=unclassified Lactobacillus TaxID=2620435 RepID=UPI00226A1348|nr:MULTISPECIES: DNA primase [unclassified Lactobacillus]MCX8721051.1 DNA primase [Lactobacillus sp. B4010]MCX8732120.1 DNA primase [Lactobacillus sp. B4015]MCX8734193.1 DNA primase [Lactobacillus sp. B4012]